MEKSTLISGILAMGLIIAVIILSFGLIERDSSSYMNTLAGTGESTIKADPDVAYLYVRVENAGTDAKLAEAKNKEVANDVLAALQALGISADKAQTDSYSIMRDQQWNQQTKVYEDKGYRVIHVFKVETSKTTEVGSLIDAVVGAGANGIDNVVFDLSESKKKEISDQALRQATQKAKDKAALLASNAGVKLGKIMSVQESTYPSPPVYLNYARAEGVAMDSASTSINPQKVEVTSTVTINYELS